MLRKNKLIIIGIIGIITAGAVELGDIFYNYFYHQNNIQVMSYKPASEDKGARNQNGYQIDKYDDIESVDWINENEVLTLSEKNLDSSPSYCTKENPASYCSVYNLNTKEVKDYKEVDIGEFLGTSPNKKYVLYSEPRNIPEVESKEWQDASKSGGMFHRNVKMLNLNTGEISDIKTRKLNCNSEYKFISDDKILINNLTDWAIIDMTGKIYYEGSFNIGDDNAVWLIGSDELKDLGDKVEGKIYYTREIKKAKDGSIGIKVCSMDVNTKEIKDIYEGPYSLGAVKKGKTIIMDYYDNNGEAVNGVYDNRTFGYYILDENGKLIHNIKQEKDSLKYILSNDGTKAVYVEANNNIKTESNAENNPSIKVVDTQTGDISEIFNASSLNDSDDENNYRKIKLTDIDGNVKEKEVRSVPKILDTCWDKTGTSIIFNYERYSEKKQKNETDTYIVTLT